MSRRSSLQTVWRFSMVRFRQGKLLSGVFPGVHLLTKLPHARVEQQIVPLGHFLYNSLSNVWGVVRDDLRAPSSLRLFFAEATIHDSSLWPRHCVEGDGAVTADALASERERVDRINTLNVKITDLVPRLCDEDRPPSTPKLPDFVYEYLTALLPSNSNQVSTLVVQGVGFNTCLLFSSTDVDTRGHISFWL